MAKLFGSHVFDFHLCREELDWKPNFENDTANCNFSKLAIWRDPATCPLAECIADATRKIEDYSPLKGKSDGGDLALVKNRTWTGCLQLIRGFRCEAFKPIAASVDMLDGTTIGPCIVSSRKWTWRFGAGVHPLAGCGAFMQADNGKWLSELGPLAPLLAAGILMTDMDAFMKTTAGVSFMEEHAVFFPLLPGQVIWVPYGHVVAQVLCHEGKPDVASAHIVMYHVLSTALANELSSTTWNAIVAASEAALNARAESCWKSAAEDFEKLVAGIKNLKKPDA